MINWEELKHIHVIKKLDEILSSWFNTAILIADGQGTIDSLRSVGKLSDEISFGGETPGTYS